MQCLICSCTSLLFSKVIFVQLICNRSNICINRIKAIGHILINIANDFILFCIGTNTVCDFLMQSSIYISKILTDRMIFLNQITFRCDILVIRDQIDTVFQSISNIIGIGGGCRSSIGGLIGSVRGVSRSNCTSTAQGFLNTGNVLFVLGNIACICVDILL